MLALLPFVPYVIGVLQFDWGFNELSGLFLVAAFAIGTGHSLEFLGETSSGGKGACHVAVDASGRSVAVANYGDGSFSSIRLDADGNLEGAATVIVSAPRSRAANAAPSRFLCVTGRDCIMPTVPRGQCA